MTIGMLPTLFFMCFLNPTNIHIVTITAQRPAFLLYLADPTFQLHLLDRKHLKGGVSTSITYHNRWCLPDASRSASHPATQTCRSRFNSPIIVALGGSTLR